MKPFITELMNPTGLALDRNGYLFVSCRNDGTIHRVSPDGRSMQWIEGMGIATGIAFDKTGKPLRGRSQRHDFQNQPRSRNFCLRDAGTVDCRLSSGVQSRRGTVCHWAHDFELRPRLSDFASWRSERFFFAGSAGRRDWLSIALEICMSPRRSGQRGIVRLTPAGRTGNGRSAAATLSAWRFCRRIAPCMPPTTLSFTLDWDVEGLPLNG